MRFRSVTTTLMCTLGLAAAAGARAEGLAATELPLAELLARHTAARGGATAIEAARSLEIELTITEPTFTLEGLYRVDRQGRMRIDVFDGGERVFTEAYDGANAWQWPSGAERASEATAGGTAALRHSAQLPVQILGLHEMEEKGHRLELLAPQRRAGVAFPTLRLTLDDGHAVDYLLDPTTYLIVQGRDVRALHPDLDPNEKVLETRWSDYRDVSGVQRAFRNETMDAETGQVVSAVTIRAIRVNPQLDPALFRAP